jgi:hypothetical protein
MNKRQHIHWQAADHADNATTLPYNSTITSHSELFSCLLLCVAFPVAT